MRTPTSFSLTTAAAVRQHFALTQAELGRWLGVTTRQVQAVEASRRDFSPAIRARLWLLADLLPLPSAALPEPASLPEPLRTVTQARKEDHEAVLLRRRIRRCQHLATNLAFQLETWALQDAALLRRRQGLAALGQALLAAPVVPDPRYDPTEAAAWLARLEVDTAAQPPRPGPLARAHLVLRERLLREEAEELARRLAAETPSAE